MRLALSLSFFLSSALPLAAQRKDEVPQIKILDDIFVQNVPLDFPIASLKESDFGKKLWDRPLAPGTPLRIAYLASHSFGVGKVQFLHQYLKETFYLTPTRRKNLQDKGVTKEVLAKLAPFEVADDRPPEPEKVHKGKKAYLEFLSKVLSYSERTEFQNQIVEQARQPKENLFPMGWRETDLGDSQVVDKVGNVANVNTSYKPEKDEGKFDVRRGVFEYTPAQRKVDYYSVPSVNGRQAGGRFHFQTSVNDTAIEKAEEGDWIQYKLKVFARNPHSRLWTESILTEKQFQSQAAYDRWEAGLNDQSIWLKKLLQGQKSVFEN